MEKQYLTLEGEDKKYLEGLLSKGSLPAKVFKRATALLELDRSKSFAAIAETLGVCYQSVSSWCKAYNQEGLPMLQDKPRSGRPVEIDGGQRTKITALACSLPPEGHSRWSLQLLADKVVELGYCEHLSRDYTRVILKNYEVHFPVVCFDERPCFLIGDEVEPISMQTGKVRKEHYTYEKNGSCALLAAIEPLTGKRLAAVYERRTKREYALFLEALAEAYPAAVKIRLVQDN